jgi:hypothetical protein
MTVGELKAVMADPMLDDGAEVVGVFPDYEEGCLICGEPEEEAVPVLECAVAAPGWLSPRRKLAFRFESGVVIAGPAGKQAICEAVEKRCCDENNEEKG